MVAMTIVLAAYGVILAICYPQIKTNKAADIFGCFFGLWLGLVIALIMFGVLLI